MSLTYANKVEINRQKELEAYKEQGLQILEESKKLFIDCDNLVKMKALLTRCEKISKPRQSIKTDAEREDKRKRYHNNKETYLSTKREKREKIRNMGQADIGMFFNDVSV